MYRKYNNDCGRTQPIMGTWSCRRDDWCDREEDERDCKHWCDREEGERGRRDKCHREEGERGCRDRCHREEDENENNIYINTNICIDQEANATAGDGGDGGEAEGGDAAFATGGLVNVAVNEVDIDADIEFPIPGLDANQTEKLQPTQAPETNTGAQGGDATGGDGGNGGNATATNVAEVTVENVIIIAGYSDNPVPLINLGSNGKNMDIKIDKEGNAFVNGKKLDSQELGDGSRVLVYRENQVKKEEKKR